MTDPLMKAVGDCISEIGKLGQKSIDFYKQEVERLQVENDELASQILVSSGLSSSHIAELQAENERLARLVVPWRKGGKSGGSFPEHLQGFQVLAEIDTEIKCWRVSPHGEILILSDGFDAWSANWSDVIRYVPLSAFPLPESDHDH